jgi:prephenate dehydratase
MTLININSIAYLGPSGSYTEAAALEYHRLHNLLNCQLCPYPTIPQAMKAVALDQVDLAVVPVENSVQGSVTMTLDTLWQWDRLQIQESLVLPIQHALITQAQKLEQITTVYSHPQALAQCQNWLEKFLPQAQLIPTNSNTEKLDHVRQNSQLAAIASRNAAELYKLSILAYPINDYADNCTRFWVLGLTASTVGTHTSLAFTANYNEPGSLVNPLSVFADRHINLTRIESRPSRKAHNPYIFFIDLEASMADLSLQEAIADLRLFTETLKIFGSYS